MRTILFLIFISIPPAYSTSGVISIETNSNDIIHQDELKETFGSERLLEILVKHHSSILNIELNNGKLIDINQRTFSNQLNSHSSGGQDGDVNRGQDIK